MVAINRIIDEHVIRYSSEGADKVVADADRIAKSEERVAAATDGTAVSVERSERRILSKQKALERFAAANDKAFRASREIDRAQALVDASFAQGLAGTRAYESAVAALARKQADYARLTNPVVAANDNIGRGLGSLATLAARAGPALAALGSALALIGGGAVLASIAKAGLQMESLERGFAAAAGSAEQGAREFAFIRDASDRLGLALGEASTQYLSFLAASRGTALQGKDTRDIFLAVTSAMGALGKDSETTSRALIAVQQMMSKGKISAEEMTGQLGEALPGALGLSAKAMGMTQQALLKLMGDGKLFAADLLPKLAKELQATYGEAAAKAANGLQANLSRMKTAWTDLQDTIARNGFNDALSRAAGDMAGFLKGSMDSAAALGRALAAVVDTLRSVGAAAVDAYDSAKVILTMIGEFDQATAGPTIDGAKLAGELGRMTDGIAQSARDDINTVIGVFVAGYEMAVAAWNGLPAAFNDIAAQAANALIGFAESAVNAPINAYNAFVGVWNDLPSILARASADGANAVAAGLSAIGSYAQGAVDSVAAAWYALPDTLAAIGNAARAGLDAALAAAGAVAASAVDFVINAWSDLPGAFGRIATAAGNALIAGIEAATNFVLRGVGKLIDGFNAFGSAIPGISFTPLEMASKVTFDRITNTSAGAAAKLKDDISGIAKAATSRDYLGEAGGALVKRFNELKDASRAAREERKRLADQAAGDKLADALKNTGDGAKQAAEDLDKAGKAAKAAAQEFEAFKGKAEEAFKKLFPEDALRKQGEELQGLLDKYRDQLAKIDPRYVTAIETQIKLNLDGKELEGVKSKADDTAKEMSQAFRGVFDEMFSAGNKGFDGLLSSFTKSLSRIGTRGLEGTFMSLFGGKEGAVGSSDFDFGKIEKAVSEGSFSGIFDGISEWLKPGANSKGGAGFASSKLGGGLLAAGVGGSIGYQSQSPLVGALGGAAAGFAAGNVPGAVIGGIAGLVGGLFGQSQAKKEAKKRIKEQLEAYKQAYKEALPEIEKLRATLRGESIGNVGLSIDQAFQQAVQANKTASQAGDQATADKIMREFEQYALRLRENFVAAFEGTLSEVSRGFGTSGPFAQANAAVAALGESLKAFVKDSESLPEAAGNSARARAAAQQSALAALDPPKALSDTQTRLAAIRGTAAGLSEVLRALGMSADEAAKAIKDRTAVAMDALRASFTADLDTKINAAKGEDYKNELTDLVKERDALMADAKAIGASTGDVTAYFKAAAQKIVDGSELTGAAFDALVKQFPALKGAVVEFSEAIDTAAAKAEAAARALGYQDRAFAAGNDSTTLAGALAAQDRKAAQDRAAEAKAGGQAMADLEKALAAERTAIVKDFAAQAAEAEKAAAEAIQRRVLSAEDRLFAARNDASTLTGKLAEIDRQHAQERLDEAAAGGQAITALEKAQAAERLKIIEDFSEQAVAAQRQALEEAQTFLTGAVKNIKAYLDGLKAGPDSPLAPADRLAEARRQFSAQLALARSGDRDALSGITGYASTLLDASKGYNASTPAYQADLKSVTDALSALPKQVSAEQFIVDAIKTMQSTLLSGVQANSPSAIAAALSANFDKLDKNLDGRLSSEEFINGLGPLATKEEQLAAKEIFNRIDTDGDGFITAIELVGSQLKTAIQANNATAFATALNSNFKTLDTSVNGLLDYSEIVTALGPMATKAEQQAAKVIFNAIDANGDGQLSQLELVKASTGKIDTATAGTKTGVEAGNTIAADQKTILAAQKLVLDAVKLGTDAQKAVLDSIKTIQTGAATTLAASKTVLDSQKAVLDRTKTLNDNQNALLTSINGFQKTSDASLSTAKDSLAELKASSVTQNSTLVELRGQFSLSDPIYLGTAKLENNMVTALNKIVYNTAGIWSEVKGGAVPAAYASGGWVSGSGTGTSDSIDARLSNGEFVVNAASARLYGRDLEMMNAGMAPRIQALPVPMPVANDNGAFLAELRALRASNERMRAELSALRGEVRVGNDIAENGHLGTIGAVKRNTVAVQEGNAAASRQALARKPKAA